MNTSTGGAAALPPVGAGRPRMACHACGTSIDARAEICPACGVRQKEAVSKTALLLITFFLGGIGGHKFYLGKYWQGALYLLFFWTYIPSIAALVEFVIYACTSSDRLNEKYQAKGSIAVVIIVAVFGGVAMVGILAAIALPAYSDYTRKAKVAQGLAEAAVLQAQIGERYAKGPADMSGEAAASGPVQRITSSRSGRIVIEYAPQVNAAPQNRLTLTPTVDGRAVDLSAAGGTGGAVQWQCGRDPETTLPARLLPVACR